MEDKIKSFLERLNIKTDKIDIISKAFIHSSYANRMDCESNERLEFLGDSVLSLCISSLLYKKYPDFNEGELTKIRAYIVSENTLANIGKKIGINELLLMSYGEEACGGRNNPSNIADAFEAFVATLFLTMGLDFVLDFLSKIFIDIIEDIKENEFIFDYKTEFQSLIQKRYRKTPHYKVIKEEGPPHQKTFYSALYFETKQISIGIGRSKKIAEQDAARKALEMIKTGKIEI